DEQHVGTGDEQHVGTGDEQHVGTGDEQHIGTGDEQHVGTGDEQHVGTGSRLKLLTRDSQTVWVCIGMATAVWTQPELSTTLFPCDL
ncbi:hypothetical protein COCON_G00113730, partial [Conger conger]